MQLSQNQKQIIAAFFADKPVLKAYVFGSYARGDAGEQSDIDILIDWDYSQPIGWQYVSIWRGLKEKLNKEIDFVSVKWVDPMLQDAINRDKQLVYERKAG